MERRVKTFRIDVRGRSETVSINHLKPAHMDADQSVVPASSRARGRPPKIPQESPLQNHLPAKNPLLADSDGSPKKICLKGKRETF